RARTGGRRRERRALRQPPRHRADVAVDDQAGGGGKCRAHDRTGRGQLPDRSHAIARWTRAVESVMGSSGASGESYERCVRSASTAVVSTSTAPSPSVKLSFAVGTPHVSVPNVRVLGRPRNATAIASPELATCLSVRTATRGSGRRSSYGVATDTMTVPPRTDAPV